MGKKKGRQSGGFASKSMRAAFVTELRNHAQEVPRRPFQPLSQSKLPAKQATTPPRSDRPKLLLNRLRGILQERQLEDRLQDREVRRRRHQLTAAMTRNLNGTNDDETAVKDESSNLERTPPGWILNYGDDDNELGDSSTRVPSLQTLCIKTLGPAMPDYLDALGRDTLHTMLELLPSSTLTALSVVVSSTVGMNDDLAFVIGQHNHVEKLALHIPLSSMVDHEEDEHDHDNSSSRGLTDQGILALVPRIVSASSHHYGEQQEQEVPESWEQMDNDAGVEMEGCIRLKRLELVNARSLSLEVVSSLLAKCSCITHLSLENSLHWNSGHELLLRLPSLLPNLQVLNVSFCSWVTDVLLRAFWRSFRQEREDDFPRVYVMGCVALSSSVIEELMYEFPGCLLTSNDTTAVNPTTSMQCRQKDASVETEEWVDSFLAGTV